MANGGNGHSASTGQGDSVEAAYQAGMTGGTFESGVEAAKTLPPERLRELLVRHYPMERRAKLAEIYKNVPDAMLLDLFGVHVEAWSLGVLMGIQLKAPPASAGAAS